MKQNKLQMREICNVYFCEFVCASLFKIYVTGCCFYVCQIFYFIIKISIILLKSLS